MKFVIDIPDDDVRKAVARRRITAGDACTTLKLILWSLEENFGVPGSGTIKVKRPRS
jgi:hypothetical protein